MRRLARHGLYIFILISLLLHVGVWTGLRFSKIPHFEWPKKDKVEFVILDQSQMPQQLKQIVEQPDKPLNDEVDPNAKYLSAHNQHVVKETRAQDSGDFKNSAGKGENVSQAKPAEAMKDAKQAAKPESKVKKFAQKTKTDSKGTLPTLSDLSPNFDPTQKPKEETLSQGNGQEKSKTNDFLKDTPPSLETVLSTREFIYYSYFERIRTQIRQYWEPSIKEKVRKVLASGRSIASERDHVTHVIIVLDREGNLIKVQIVGESGVKDLDDAAVEAFRAAAPFPNPPKGIVDKDGTIKIDWSFVLQAENGSDDFKQRFARQERAQPSDQ